MTDTAPADGETSRAGEPETTPADTGGESVDAPGDTGDSDTSRRTLIRLLVGLGIGIPVAVELSTFVGLVGQQLTGGEDGDAEGGGTTATPEPSVGVGEELLPETGPAETLADAQLRAGDRFVLTLTVSIENTTPDPYTFRFGPVTVGGGRRVAGEGNGVTVEPGATRTIADRWELPAGSQPERLTVETGRDELDTHSVRLAKIPVQG